MKRRWCDGELARRLSNTRGVCTCGREGALTLTGRIARHLTQPPPSAREGER